MKHVWKVASVVLGALVVALAFFRRSGAATRGFIAGEKRRADADHEAITKTVKEEKERIKQDADSTIARLMKSLDEKMGRKS